LLLLLLLLLLLWLSGVLELPPWCGALPPGWQLWPWCCGDRHHGRHWALCCTRRTQGLQGGREHPPGGRRGGESAGGLVFQVWWEGL